MVDVPARDSVARPAVDVATLIRGTLFIAAFLLAWITVHPFQDRSDPTLGDLNQDGDRVNQIAFLLLFTSLVVWTWLNEPGRLRPLVRPILLVTLLWFGFCVVTSGDPGLSARRLTFTVMVMVIAATVLMLPKNLREFANWLAAAVLIVLALSYLGLVLVPDLAIHQWTDALEPEHDGNWRGVFSHKNEAGPALVVFVFIGLFVARVSNRKLGAVIIALATVFLVFSFSKTSTVLLPFVLLLSYALTRLHSLRLRMVIALTGLVAFNVFSVGSVYWPPIKTAVEAFMSDPTYTGRTDIWEFAIEKLAERPLLGYGFSAFWGTDRVVFGSVENVTWATAAADAHNAYLNMAITTGIPGLALVILLVVVLPLIDYQKGADDDASRALSTLFMRIWLFGVYVSCFESIIFPQGGRLETWFVMLVAIFGLRYLTLSRARP